MDLTRFNLTIYIHSSLKGRTQPIHFPRPIILRLFQTNFPRDCQAQSTRWWKEQVQRWDVEQKVRKIQKVKVFLKEDPIPPTKTETFINRAGSCFKFVYGSSGVGFIFSNCSPLLREMIQFDEHIFPMGRKETTILKNHIFQIYLELFFWQKNSLDYALPCRLMRDILGIWAAFLTESKKQICSKKTAPLKLTAGPWKSMLGRWHFLSGSGLFSLAILLWGSGLSLRRTAN